MLSLQQQIVSKMNAWLNQLPTWLNQIICHLQRDYGFGMLIFQGYIDHL